MSQSAKDILIIKAISLFNEGSVKKSLKEALVAKKNTLMSRSFITFWVSCMQKWSLIATVLKIIRWQ